MRELDLLFERIKAFADGGGDINSYYPDSSVLYEFLEAYYWQMYDTDVDRDENYYHEELWMSLEERPNSIEEQIKWLINHGADTNADGDWPPLIPPVANLDYAMTEFLLNHGADPHYDGDDEGGVSFGCGNYYIDDLDITLLNYSFEPDARQEIFDQALKIAVLFAKHGVTDVHTRCVSIDGATRTVSVAQARVKY